MSKNHGRFSLLLDENFDIVWQSDSVTAMLGWPDLSGRNATEFVHPEDIELVLRTMMQINERDEFYDVLDSGDSPESSASGSSTGRDGGGRSNRPRGVPTATPPDPTMDRRTRTRP